MSELSCGTRFIGRNETHDLSRYPMIFQLSKQDTARALKARLQALAKIQNSNSIRMVRAPRSSSTSGVAPNLVKLFRILMMTPQEAQMYHEKVHAMGLDGSDGDFSANMGLSFYSRRERIYCFYVSEELDQVVRSDCSLLTTV